MVLSVLLRTARSRKICYLGNQSAKRKRGSYHRYAPEVRAKISRYANEHGLKAATKYFAVELGHEVRHSTIQGMQKQFNQELAKVVDPAKISALRRIACVDARYCLAKNLTALCVDTS